jgi:hypothetical protein
VEIRPQFRLNGELFPSLGRTSESPSPVRLVPGL